MRNQYQGPGQLVNLKPGKMYKFSVYIKQLNDMPGKTSQIYRAKAGFTGKDDGKICSRNTDPTTLDSPVKTMQLRLSSNTDQTLDSPVEMI